MLTIGQLRGARGMLGWSARELADKSGVGMATIQRMEKRGPSISTVANVEAVKAALEKAGIEFIPQNGGGAGVRFRNAQ